MPDVAPAGGRDPLPPAITALPRAVFLRTLESYQVEHEAGQLDDYYFRRGETSYGPIILREPLVGENAVKFACAEFGIPWADFYIRAATGA